MSQTCEHKGSLSKAALQLSLQNAEAGLFKLTKIEVAGSKTKSTHDNDNPVPDFSLVLVEDPNDDAKGPEGSTLICRGKALIGGDEKKVALFRKKPA